MAKRKKSQPAPKKAAVAKRRTFRPDWPITCLAIAGLAVTGYLSVARTLSTSPLLCGEGSSCDLVQQSHWSLLLGLPVSLWGFGLYLLIALIAGLGRPRLKRWQRLWMLSYFGVAFSVYLTLAGWLALEAFCLWCTISLGLIAAIFVVLNLRRPESAPGMSWGGFLGGQTTTVAVALLALHAVYAGWLPAGGWDWTWQSAVLPVITLALPVIAYIARLMRGSMIEVLHSDFIRTARAKGLPERQVILRHALKPALLPVLSYMGPATAALITGSVVVERIFSIPGLGSYFVQGALNRDYTLVMGVVMFYGVLIIVLNLLVDLLYALLDPKIRYEDL